MRNRSGHRVRLSGIVLTLFSVGGVLLAQTRGAELVHQTKPAYPDTMSKASAQGSVVVIARIDKTGAIADPVPVWASNRQFVQSALASLKTWSFRPALKDGRPIDIAANLVFPFRIRDEKGQATGHQIGPAVGELAIFPASDSGQRTAPEGFPIQKGKDRKVRVEASIDLPPQPAARKVPVTADVVSPGGRRLPVFHESIEIPAQAATAKIPFTFAVGPSWEDGVWKIRLTADGADAGVGQFWLARDPATFDFAQALRRVTP